MWRIAVLLMGLGLLATACSSNTTSATSPPVSTHSQPASRAIDVPLAEYDIAPNPQMG